jgi:CheY-like chemotaxis protein
VRLKGDFIDLRVIDTGLGIPAAMKAKIFEEFIQLQSPAAREKNVGMGLGLSIAKRLSTILGSNIRLYSHEGTGSVFALRLPMRIKLNAKVVTGDVKVEEVEYDRISGSLIVVIDDDPKICEASKLMLELHGAEVVVAESGAKAINLLAFGTRIPSLILSDYRLIGENGLACIENIRNEFNEAIPALVITGDTAPDELNLLKNSGVEVLYKPIHAEVLLAAISRNIAK